MTREESELLTRIGPGTPCGDLMRRYWQPAALSEELAPGGSPKPVRLLGEDLVLFRNEQGRPALLGLHCSHRGADLSYGRLEDGGLRCIYHGWLYDFHGNCLDQPGEPGGGEHRGSIRHPAYPCKEQSGVVFAYLGPGEPPLLPNYPFLNGSADRVFVTKLHHECNYLQANEGNVDPVHTSFLHRSLQEKHPVQTAPEAVDVEIVDFGLRVITVRKTGEERNYLRVTNFIYPNLASFAVKLPGDEVNSFTLNWHVPIDDARHWKYTFILAEKPLDKDAMKKRRAETTPDYKPARNKQNRYLQDRDSMKTKSFSGLGFNFQIQDLCVTEGMGLVQDRTREHLVGSDKAVVALRKLLLRAIENVQNGREAPHVIRESRQNRFPHLVALSEIIPSSADWRERIKSAQTRS